MNSNDADVPSGDSPPLSTSEASLDRLDESVRRWLERHALPHFLCGKRWFLDSDADSLDVTVEVWHRVERRTGGALFVSVCRVVAAGGEEVRYFVPLSLSPVLPAGGRAGDGAAIEHADSIGDRSALIVGTVELGSHAALLLDAVAEQGLAALVATRCDEPIKTADGELRWRACGGATSGDSDESVERLMPQDVDSSNSLVRIGSDRLLKIYRRLTAGVHPEVELTNYLSSTGVACVPRLHRTLEFTASDGSCSTLAVISQYIEGAEDGWALTQRNLSSFLDSAADDASDRDDAPTRAVASHVPPMSSALMPQSPRFVDQLAISTAAFHLAFGRATSPEMRPQQLAASDRTRMIEELDAQIAALVERLRGVERTAAPPARELIQRLLGEEERLRRPLSELAAIDPLGFEPIMAIRCHGDFHLGQVLWRDERVWVLDFEGEPNRSAAERRRRSLVFRDLAGMLRSFSYAAAVASHQRPELASLASDWERAVCCRFVSTHREQLEGTNLLPADAAASTAWLEAFQLEKVLYEVGYELDHRPYWIHVPLRGLLRLIGLDSE